MNKNTIIRKDRSRVDINTQLPSLIILEPHSNDHIFCKTIEKYEGKDKKI